MKKILLSMCVFMLLLTGCQAECEVQKHSDEDYVELMFEYSKLEDSYKELERENILLKNSKDSWEKKYLDSLIKEESKLSDSLTNTYSYINEGKSYYISACHGVTFYLDQELPSNFFIKDNKKDGYFGIFYQDKDIIEPVYVFTVLRKDSIVTSEEAPSREIFHEYDNGLCVVNSYVGFNGSSISHDVWEKIIDPFIDNVTVHFE